MRNIPTNFKQNEITIIARYIGQNMTMRINKCGNIDLEFVKPTGVHFVVYKRTDGVYIRRRLKCDNPFGCGTYLNNGRPFPSVKDAMRYFANYKEVRKP
jgi:hypothetical protein